MKYVRLYKLSLLTAWLPIIVGTIIFWIWFYFPELRFLELWGIWTMLVSIPVCIIGLVLVTIYFIVNKGFPLLKQKCLKALFLILSNIPLSAFYLWFSYYIINTERITLNNNSDSCIQDIEFFGAGQYEHIDIINKGSSKTIWIHMIREGSIMMKYIKDGQIDTSCLVGYSGPMMGGHRIKYDIVEMNNN